MSTLQSPTYVVTDEQKAHYREHGYVVIPNLLTREELAELVDRVDGLLEGRYTTTDCIVGSASNNTGDDPGRLIKQVMPTRIPVVDPILRRSSEHPALLSIASQLLETEPIELLGQQALVKDPGQLNATPWHQDDFYWNTNSRAITAWFPLEPVYPDSGTMSVIPGSHTGPMIEHGAAGGVSAFQEAQGVDESKAVPLLMEPGGVSFHHARTIHGAHGNRGRVRRIAVAQHYASKAAMDEMRAASS